MAYKKKVSGKELRAKMGKAEVPVDAYSERKKEYGEYEKYEVEGWARTLEESIEIMTDKKKLAAVEKCLAKRESSIDKLRTMLSGKDVDSE